MSSNPFLRFQSTASASAPAPTTLPSRRALLAAGLALAAGTTYALTPSDNSSPPTTALPPRLIDYSDPLSALEPEVLMASTNHLHEIGVADLVRQYIVFLGSSQTFLVSAGPWCLHKLEWMRDHVPLVGDAIWQVFALSMKETFFHVFVGGATVPECKNVIDELAEHGIGCLLNYSAEDSGTAADAIGLNQINIAESIRAVQAAAQFESPRSDSADSMVPHSASDYSLKPTLFAIKLTGLVYEPQLLTRATQALTESSSFQRGADLPSSTLFPSSPSLSDADHEVLAELYQGLRKVATAAQNGGVRLLVDAEYAHSQPAIDRFVDLLSAEFNKVTPENSSTGPAIPIIYNTYQTYLRSAPETMKAAMARADAGNYSFGAKLVRGAYVDFERKRYAAAGGKGECIVWSSKPETDACFDHCALLLEQRIARDLKEGKKGQPGTGAVFASHNGPSMGKVLAALRSDGLAKNVEGGLAVDERVRGRISFAQLFGMSDNLTGTLVNLLSVSKVGDSSPTSIPLVTKYLPYASLNQALPYLIRRAGENQSILQPDHTSGRGGAVGERRAIGKELRSRFFGFSS